MYYSILIQTIVLSFLASSAWSKTVHYDLNIENKPLNMSGKKTVDFALTVNGGIPAPTLEFTEGDTAEIKVTNKMLKEDASIHWHGILLPPEMDGVPYVNTPPILPGESFVFKFLIRQHGTYWYHSHTHSQEQKGVFGAIIIHPKKKLVNYDKDVVVVLSDWIDDNPDHIGSNLRKDGDYYLFKKNTLRSWWGAISKGKSFPYFMSEWTRMGAMDLSDVGYDAFLMNGKKSLQLLSSKKGDKIRLRIINAAASTYFYINLGEQLMEIISSDGIDVKPVKTKELLMGMAETYDVLFTVPDNKNYELRATAQDITGYASGYIGVGDKEKVKDKPAADLYEMHGDHGSEHGGSHSGHGSGQGDHATASNDRAKPAHETSHADHHAMLMKPSERLSVDNLMAKENTAFAKDKKIHEVKLELDGDMRRYVWFINGKAIHQDRNIIIHEGDVVRFSLENKSMMHHPLHLHGHFFRVLGPHGDFSPLKHTVDVPPFTTRTIEFLANEPGEWMLHCHNLYHMETGMARVVKYFTFTPSTEIQDWQKKDPHIMDHWYFYGMLEASTNHAQSNFRLSQTWNELDLKLESRDYYSIIESDFRYRRWFGKYFNLTAGATYFSKKTKAVAGIGYILPMLVDTTLLISGDGKLILDLAKEIDWANRISTHLDYTFREREPSEWEISLMYSWNWHTSAGIKLTDDGPGVGLQMQF